MFNEPTRDPWCRMDFLQILFMNLAIVFLLIAVHETGHFLAGVTSGIPGGDMRIRLFSFPQHVAIRDGDSWLSPANADEIQRYIELTRRYFQSRAAAFRWVAGGVVVEAVFTVTVSVSAHLLGLSEVAFWTATMSLGMYLINVFLMDLPWALLHRHAFGDTSGLWTIAKIPAVLLTLAMLLIRGGLLWYVTR